MATGGEAKAVNGTVDGMEEEGEADCGGGRKEVRVEMRGNWDGIVDAELSRQ